MQRQQRNGEFDSSRNIDWRGNPIVPDIQRKKGFLKEEKNSNIHFFGARRIGRWCDLFTYSMYRRLARGLIAPPSFIDTYMGKERWWWCP